MVYFLFILAVIVTVFAAIKISTYADAITRLSSVGALFVGTFLLAGATSLPEVTTSVTAVFLDNPDMAVGNVLGSNLFNLSILAVFLLIYRHRAILNSVHKEQRHTAILGVLMTTFVVVALFYTIEIPVVNIGVESLVLLFLYGLSIWLLRGADEQSSDAEDEKATEEKYTLKHAITGFIIAAIFILISGTVLTFSGDQIAILTGLGSSFVGSFLIATSTSLPEVVTVYVALKLGNHNLAAASIFGSNLFNLLILVLCDFLYPGSILLAASPTNIYTGGLLLLSSLVVTLAIFRAQTKRRITVAFPIMMLLFYASSMVLLYLLR
ncbi:hypothetical protein DH09_03375 [Bacillaceae bacterium JMAK1]|nr:hypothetical protein DH09_03375 [Bacillaceae bacterium JMAK1]